MHEVLALSRVDTTHVKRTYPFCVWTVTTLNKKSNNHKHTMGCHITIMIVASLRRHCMCTRQNLLNAGNTCKQSTPLETHVLERQHCKNPESHQIRCDNQHCIPPELIFVAKVVPKEVVNDCVVAIKTLHIVIPVAKLVHSKGIENPG